MKHLSRAGDLWPTYRALLLDQFGTLHDGTHPYPGVIAALERLRAAGMRMVLLSNSGKPSAENHRRLMQLGFAAALFETVITSGEVARQLLADGAIAAARGARRCLLIARGSDGGVLDGLGLEAVAADRADLVMIAGSEGEHRSLESYTAELRPLAQAGVPALCLNPDRTTLTPLGLAFGAGRIAEVYADMGGPVTWIGKPHPAIYRAALAVLGDVPPDRIAAVGDSVEHDIAGGQSVGVSTWLVRSGIAEGLDDAALAAEYRRHNAVPDGILAGFGET